MPPAAHSTVTTVMGPCGSTETIYYRQPGLPFRLMSPHQQTVLFANTARAIGRAPKEIQLRHIGNCLKADPAYGQGVAAELGIPLSELPKEA